MLHLRHGCRGKSNDHMLAKSCQDNAGASPGHGIEDAFIEELIDQPIAAGSQRDANAELLVAGHTSCQEQRRKVETGNQEQKTDGTAENDQVETRATD